MTDTEQRAVVDLAMFALRGICDRLTDDACREIAALPQPRDSEQVRAILAAHVRRAVDAIDRIPVAAIVPDGQ